MCGICGFIGYKNEALLRGMTGALAHRGPDDDGFFTDEDRASLGMRRLKIIDLATGAQPISNEDGAVTVIFNGEIYNFKELRRELEASGHRFKTKTDTEVLVHLYEEHGEDFPSRLRGMFAFAIWDSRKRKLLLARDQFGIKPLFYAVSGDKLFFASELKALLLVPGLDLCLSPEAIDAYFSFLYIPAPLTVYKNIKKLEPAQTLVFSNGKAVINTYWSVPKFRASGMDEAGYLEGIDRLLSSSVTEQMVSDVPIGLLLSGGVDSGAALYYMSRAMKEPVKTFTIGYGPKDASFDETGRARLLAGHFHSEHTEAALQPDVRGIMRKLAAQFDEPFADASAIPTYLVTGEARKKVTVALTGIGGDEIFGGYPRHMGARLLPLYLRLPSMARKFIWEAARHAPESVSSSNTPGRIKRFLRGGLGDFRSGYEDWTSYFSKEERARLYAGGMGIGGAAGLSGRLAAPDDIYSYEIRNYLSDDLLCLADRTSMANSLELRVPFVDTRLVEFMAGASMALKTRGFELKYLLKKLMAGRLPPEVTGGAKRGFQVPLARWQKEDIKGFIEETLSPAALKKTGLLEPAFVQNMLKEHAEGRRNLGDQIYAATMFELWAAGTGRRPLADTADRPIELRAPLNILICTDIIQSDDEGGSGRVAWEVARQLAAMGHRVYVLTKGVNGRERRETVNGVAIYRYFSSPFQLLRAVREIQAKGRIDVMNFHHPYTGLLTRLAAGKIPSVYIFHSPWAEEFSMRCADLRYSRLRAVIGAASRGFVEKLALAGCSIIVLASRFMADKLKSAHGRDSRIIPLGVDTDKFSPVADRAVVRARLGIPEDKFLIFTVRNLVTRMGLENLVEAAALLAKVHPEVLFIIGGRGYLKGKLETMIKSAGLSGNVRLTGFIPEEDLQCYYQCADLFVLPTTALEGFGLVTLEALACGTPVLATPVAANIEVLGDFDKEMLFKSDSPADISDGIAAFMSKYRGGMEALRAKCRRFVELNYSWQKYALKIEKIFYEASGNHEK